MLVPPPVPGRPAPANLTFPGSVTGRCCWSLLLVGFFAALRRSELAALTVEQISTIGSDLTRTLRALKLSGLTDTLPERLALARQHKMGHAAFLELLLADEVARRDSRSAMLRARAAGLDPTMRLDTWDEPDDLRYDRTLWSDLTSLRFTDAHHGVGDPGTGRGRQDPPRRHARPHRHPPADERAFLPRRQAVHR